MSEVSISPEVEIDRRNGINTPVLTWVMSGLCVLLTLANQTSGHSPVSSFWYRIGHFGHLPATAIWEGHWPALFTTFFIHGDPARPLLTLAHIGFNLFVLIQAGRVLEATLHPIAYYFFFVMAAMIGSGAELALSGSTGVGASGVVYAMFGLLWAGRAKDKEWAEVANTSAIAMVVGWAVICVVLTRMRVMNIANAAHFAGLLFGLAVGWVFIAKRFRLIGGFLLVALTSLVVLSLTWLPWSPYWTFWRGVESRRHRQYAQAIDWFNRSQGLGMDPSLVGQNIDATIYIQNHPEVKGVLQYVPEQPDTQRFGNQPGSDPGASPRQIKVLP